MKLHKKMKNFKRTSLLCAILLLSIAQSCSSENTNGIYKIGREWTFQVTFYKEDKLVDSCQLIMAVKRKNLFTLLFLSGQKNLTYEYGDCCRNNYKDTTGVQEDEKSIFLHPPRMGCLSFTHVSPMPSIDLPFDEGAYSEINLKVVMSSYPNLSGKTIKQFRKNKGTDSFLIDGKRIKCFVTEGKNVNYIKEIGAFSNRFLFNEKYGFVSFTYYNPNNERVEFRLKKTNFTP